MAMDELLKSNQKWMESMLKAQQEWMDSLLDKKTGISQTVNAVPQFRSFDERKETFDSYIMQLQQHFIGYRVETDDIKRAYFLSWIGTSVYELMKNIFGDQKLEEKSFEDLVDRLKNHYKDKTHVLASRFKFRQVIMKPNQSYASWIADLRGAAQNCDYRCAKCKESFVDNEIRDMIILHTPHDSVRTAAFQLEDHILAKVLVLAETYESTQKSINVIKEIKHDLQPNMVNTVEKSSYHKRGRSRSRNRGQRTNRFNSRTNKSCPGCFSQHQRSDCRFFSAKCNNCGKIGHIAAVCNSKTKSDQQRNRSTSRYNGREDVKNVDTSFEFNSIQTLELSESSDYVVSNELSSSNEGLEFPDSILRKGRKLLISVCVNGKQLDFQVDTGATCSMVGLNGYKQLSEPPVRQSKQSLRAYGNTHVPVKGILDVNVEYDGNKYLLPLLVTNSQDGSNILGMDWFDAFNFDLMQKSATVSAVSSRSDSNNQPLIQDMCKKFEAIFQNTLGCCVGFQAHLQLYENASPKFFKPRPIPFAQLAEVKIEIERLQSQEVIKPVQFSRWATPIVVTTKANGSIRICGDFKATVNPQIEVERFPIPRAEELFHKLQNGKYFSKIDLSDAYFQIELDEESKQLMVINTPFGLFQYQRLPFGVSSAPAIFQRLIEQVIAGLTHCGSYLDDIIVTGTNDEHHLRNLESLFQRLHKFNLRCNLNKSKFFQSEVEYLGHIIDAAGIRPADSGLRAIQDLPQPRDVKQLEAFMGKCNYYNKFVMNFSQISAPLNKLRRKDVPFEWGRPQEEAFQAIKGQIIDAAKLVHFRDDYPVLLATDASSYGIGAVLSHRYPDGSEHPIAFASKTLADYQKAYSQIEKEALSIVFGCTKFNQYLYGRHFELFTDHQSLVPIFHPHKQIPTMTAHRLQRWAIKLMAYDFTIKYKPTSKHGNADALSRLPCGPDEIFDRGEDGCFQIDDEVDNQLNVFPVDATIIQEATTQDPILSRVVNYVQYAWPRYSEIDEDIMAYFRRRTSLTVRKGTLLLHTEYVRVVIPTQLRSKVLNILHECHWGTVRMKQMARRYCWWPNVDRDIEKLSVHCEVCQGSQADPKREFSAWPAPVKPWERVHLDFAGPFIDNMWLICIDAYSKFPYITRMRSTTAVQTIRSLQLILGIEGIPDTIVTDNGPQFVSGEFKKFCELNGIQHLTTAPFHPASNGQAERTVRTFKRSMEKILTTTNSPDEALTKFLVSYRTTPSTILNGKTPAELLHGRQPKTILSLLSPKVELDKVGEPKFQLGQKVFTKNYARGPRWVPGAIAKLLGKMVYLVKTDRGLWKRHQNQIRQPKMEKTLLSENGYPASSTDQSGKHFDILVNRSNFRGRLEDSTGSEKVDIPHGEGDHTPREIPRRSERVRRPVVRFSPAAT